MSASKPLRMEDAHDPKIPHRDVIWWMQASDTGVIVGAKNPHMEADGDEGGIWYAPTHDGLVIVENGEIRDATRAEEDEYSDDVHDWLRACDWEV